MAMGEEMSDQESFHKRVKDHDTLNPEMSELISINEFKEKMTKIYRENCQEGLEGADEKMIHESMEVPNEVFKKCLESCSIGNLLPKGGQSFLQHQKRIDLPKDTTLESVNNLSLVDQYTSLKPILIVAPSVSIPSDRITPSSLVSCPEIIISVLMFHPIKRRVQAEYLVLGSQKLTELKDMLFCPRDYVITHDYSQTPDLFDRQSLIRPPTPSKSAFFFINNTFYNDMRDIGAEDYSSEIMEWIESSPERLLNSPRLDNFQKADMSNTSFQDISARLGYPYLYCHHGNCEHLIVLTDLRLFSSHDVQDKNRYPLLTSYWKLPRKRCCVCEEFTAMWATVDDQMAAETPAFFCTTCFKMLHYTIDGKKVTDFQAYPFFDELSTLLESAATTSKQI